MEFKALERPSGYSAEPRSSSSFSLAALLAIVTGAAIFLGVYRLSGTAALAGTLIFTPAVIRMIIVMEQFRRQGVNLSWFDRAAWFAGSVGLVLMTLSVGAISFLVVCVLFGIMGLVMGFAIGSQGLEFDTAVVGTAGGMVWGLAGALLAITYCVWRFWMPPQLQD